MTSKQIESTAPTDLSTNAWLKVVALQLSILIESISAEPTQEKPETEKRGPGRPRKAA